MGILRGHQVPFERVTSTGSRERLKTTILWESVEEGIRSLQNSCKRSSSPQRLPGTDDQIIYRHLILRKSEPLGLRFS